MPRANRMNFSFQGDAGEHVSHGASASYTNANAKITVQKLNGKNMIEFRIDPGNMTDPWTLEFAAPKGKRLRAQKFEGATRYPFQDDDAPGLTMSGDHRGNNHNFGEFTIQHIRFNKGGELVLFAAEFVQHMEQPNGPAVRGSIYYHNKPQPVAVEAVAK